MNIALNFIRVIFFILSIFFMSVYMAGRSDGNLYTNIFYGILVGSIFGSLLIAFSYYFRRYNLRSFNILVLGIFFGYFLGLGLNLIFDTILEISRLSITGELLETLDSRIIEMVKVGLFLFGIFLGSLLTLRAADELYVSIPFVKFTPATQKKKDIVIDLSVLKDARIIDLASSGFLDGHLIVPRFIVKDLYALAESSDEMRKTEARKCLEVLKKLENLPDLDLRYSETDFPEVKETMSKLLRLSRLLDANILSADVTKVQTSTIEDIKILNLHTLSNAIKPLNETGETLEIKVQRAGKEPNQGVGYLEDGTMVVINGAKDYIDRTVRVYVLSVKHTSSGRMIFCNLQESDEEKK